MAVLNFTVPSVHRRGIVIATRFFLAAAAMYFLATSARAQSPEYKLKAVYLFNFVQFVDWPETAFADEKSPLIVGVLGNDPFGKTLDATVEEEVLKGRLLVVRRYRNVKEIKECHVLYVNVADARNQKSILAALKGRSILTVSDAEGFTANGGIIQFITKDNKIGFQINTDAAKAANLSISSKLLQLAKVISTEKR